jgi:hypothetical protein
VEGKKAECASHQCKRDAREIGRQPGVQPGGGHAGEQPQRQGANGTLPRWRVSVRHIEHRHDDGRDARDQRTDPSANRPQCVPIDPTDFRLPVAHDQLEGEVCRERKRSGKTVEAGAQAERDHRRLALAPQCGGEPAAHEGQGGHRQGSTNACCATVCRKESNAEAGRAEGKCDHDGEFPSSPGREREARGDWYELEQCAGHCGRQPADRKQVHRCQCGPAPATAQGVRPQQEHGCRSDDTAYSCLDVQECQVRRR